MESAPAQRGAQRQSPATAENSNSRPASPSNSSNVEEATFIRVPAGYTDEEYLEAGLKNISLTGYRLTKYENPSRKKQREIDANIEYFVAFLPWLEHRVHMTPQLKRATGVHKGLEMMWDPKWKFPASLADEARRIYKKFDEEKWGRDIYVGDQDDQSSDGGDASSATSSVASNRPMTAAATDRAADTTRIRLPPADHPIWGNNGIMHGIVQKNRSREFDPRYLGQKKNPKVYGHNGLRPGDWFPVQLVANFRGAHGAPVAGIVGNKETGAYSIVISGKYDGEGMDRDDGDTIWYSSDDAFKGKDPIEGSVRSPRTQSLVKSIQTRNPVRVLRAAGHSGKRRWAPEVGIRYDGLYRVVSSTREVNKKGKLYDRFKLTRLPDQRALDDIQAKVPTRQQRRDYARIKDAY